MNTTVRRAVLLATALLAAFVGVWAAFFPMGFYDAFPGLGLTWVAVDGPYNEHLVRDVGGLYLGFAVAGLLAARARSAAPGQVIGAGWAVFGLVHLGYHLEHLTGSPVDKIGNVVGLGLSLLFGLALVLLPQRDAARAEVAR
jgi:hypothetical protein